MSSDETQKCPKTCGQLSTAALLLCVGVVQLLSGIILLRSEYIYLLAGIDFVAAISNALVGGSLGISSSVWEKKETKTSAKSIARQNVLAGLYISVMAVNATTAIIMILGDGNRLLTVPHQGVSASFVAEMLACAYVASVCSPIVCIVVALVCLSGNRIQIYEHAKSRQNQSKESSGWIYDKKKVKLSDVLSSPSRASFSDDNVFLDKNAVKGTRGLLKGQSKKTASYSLHSISEIQSPLEFLAQKRKKILEEITSPKPTFFADDYLQFPEFKYGSYVEKILPRIKQSSVHSKVNPMKSVGSHTKEIKIKETEFNSARLKMNEVNKEFIAKQRSYSDSTNLSAEQQNEFSNSVPSSNQPPMDVTDSKPRHHSVDFDIDTFDRSPSVIQYCSQRSPSRVTVLDPCEVFLEERNIQLDSTGIEMTEPVSSRIVDFKADTIKELKFKLNHRNEKENLADEIRVDTPTERNQFNYSNSDIADRYTGRNNVFSENTDFDSSRQIALLTSPRADRMNSAPVLRVQPLLSSPPTSSNPETDSKRAASLYVRNSKEKYFKDYGTDYKKSCSLQQKRRDVAHKISSMGSIAESPAEENCDPGNLSSRTLGARPSTPTGNLTLPPKRSTSLLKKIWSSNGCGEEGERAAGSLSDLIMDADSLVGLSDEQLLNRTNRIRILRKSVQVRSKTDEKTDAVKN